MKKLLALLVFLVGLALAVRYFHREISWLTEASDEDSRDIGDMDQPLPPAVMPAVGGNWVDIKGFRGSVILISFWTTWCPGCRDEIPDLIRLQKQYKPRGFTVVAISVDDDGEESVDTFMQTERFLVDGLSLAINFPVLRGTDEVVRPMGFEGGLPASVLVNRDSREVKIIRGPFHERAVAKAIERLL
jgi:thiol-disulfide isomerase/thioredoxin